MLQIFVLFTVTTYNFLKVSKRRAIIPNYKEFINGFFVYCERCGFFWRKIRWQMPLMEVCKENAKWERRGILVKVEQYFWTCFVKVHAGTDPWTPSIFTYGQHVLSRHPSLCSALRYQMKTVITDRSKVHRNNSISTKLCFWEPERVACYLLSKRYTENCIVLYQNYVIH